MVTKVTPQKKSVRLHPLYFASETTGTTRAWARTLHGSQKDKNGLPYVTHLDAVAGNTVMLYGFDLDLIQTAYLHDVLEDTRATMVDLFEEKFSDSIVEAVTHITKKQGEKNYDYISRVLECTLAAQVKLADLLHNTNPNRLAKQPAYTQARLLKKYYPAIWRIETALGLATTVTFQQAYDALCKTNQPTWTRSKAGQVIVGDSLRFSQKSTEYKVTRKESKTSGPDRWITFTFKDGVTTTVSSETPVEYRAVSAVTTSKLDAALYLGYKNWDDLVKDHPEIAPKAQADTKGA